MSDATVRWAKGFTGVSARAKRVLELLAARCGDDHSCALRQEEMAAETEQSVRTVRSHLGALEAVGALRREVRQRVEGRGREPDLYFLAVPAEEATTNRQPTGNQPAKTTTNRQPTGNFSRPADYAFEDLNTKQTPPTPPLSGAGRFPPQAPTLDTLPGPMVCDDWERASGHLECRRVAVLVVDAASRRAQFPLIPEDRKRLLRRRDSEPNLVMQWLQAGHSPDAIADAIAGALSCTGPSISFELNKARARFRPSSKPSRYAVIDELCDQLKAAEDAG